jgi:isopentenyl phosphate kinase
MLQFVKFGGSLITDKTQASTARCDVLERLAREVRAALDARPELRLLLGHGSGSFGHWAAVPYGTYEGVRTPDQWSGFVRVAAAAARLNRLVSDALLDADVPVLALQPSASARCHDGELTHLDTHAVHTALARNLVPLVYGDVALDDVRGGTIASTEDLFVYLADELGPARILLLGCVPGVLDQDGEVIAQITPSKHARLGDALSGSQAVDVTGGMADKVARMVDLVRDHPETTVHIVDGMRPGLLARALLEEELHVGTRISASLERR